MYEGLYKASNIGKFKSFKDNHGNYREKILKQTLNKQGYFLINLYKNKQSKSYLCGRLILETFVGPCPTGMECRHLDNNPENNRLNNLEWATHQSNMDDQIKYNTRFNKASGEKNGMAKLNHNKIIEIKNLYKQGVSQKEIAKIIGISQSLVSNIINNKIWREE